MSPRHLPLLGVLFVFSGAAALVYQVLWVRELGLLFGSTAEAAALTIAIFFAGIALGGWLFGRLAGRLRRPLAAFGLVEIGVGLTALGHFLVADSYFALYPVLHAAVGGVPALETAAKALVAATILLPPAILMGGTLPLIGQHVVRAADGLGRLGSALYALNTAGGAAGALAAGFVLPVWLGFSGAYLLAVGTDIAVGLAALALARRAGPVAATPDQTPALAGPAAPRGSVGVADPSLPRGLWAVAFLSGFATLAVEVIWTRLFAQVLQNSVYTYALVLTVFLAALALGAMLANALARLTRPAPAVVLTGLLLASAAVVAGTPHLFHHLTDGLSYLGGRRDFAGYVAEVARVAALTMLLPGAVLGAVLPYLLRLLQTTGRPPGEMLGRLIAVNTTGAIFGALAGGFLILPTLGAWQGLWTLAALYLLLPLALSLPRAFRPLRLVAPAGALALTLLMPPLDSIRLRAGEGLVEMREGTAAHVAVIRRDEAHFIRVNNFYTLGGSGALVPERNQTMIPLLLHPDPREIFFLGMGTGISAGAGLFADPDRVTVCELVPEVIDLARTHFRPYVNGLFDDPRVTIWPEDGRQCLARSRATYDLIIADLFTPWRAGVGNVYTVEHYRLAARRLNPGGAYVQWIPLYQVSRAELDIIAATMAEVFPELTLWRGDLYPERSILALVGRTEPAPLDPGTLARQWRALTGAEASDDILTARALKFYAGNAASGLFAGAPLNTDDRPRIEYLAPRTHRAVITGAASWVIGPERDTLFADLLDALPPEADPHLARLTPDQHEIVRAGQIYTAWRGARARGEDTALALWSAFARRTPPDARAPDSPAGDVGRDTAAFGDATN
ncbi:MAG: fused MFS/spermidine synthase [Alkalilacustris sp.]